MFTDADTYAATATLVGLSDVRVSGPGLTLDSRYIDDKFGFNDGDVPEAVIDMVDTYHGKYVHVERFVWHRVLMHLVQTRLLPALGNPSVDLYQMNSLHNPIRTKTPLSADFPHGTVTVPWLDVLTTVLVAMSQYDD